MAIYTKKGDGGESSILDKKRIPKDSSVFEVLGALDELNSFLGLTTSFLKERYLKNKITQVQRTIFKLASIIAGAKGNIPISVVTKYEKEIDYWTRAMPPLKKFIYPGGSKAAAFLYVSRAIARRAERLIVKLGKEKKVHPTILIYINRVSDYLFTLGRYINFREKIKETEWN